MSLDHIIFALLAAAIILSTIDNLKTLGRLLKSQ